MLKPHPLDNSISDYLEALGSAGYLWIIRGGPRDIGTVDIQSAKDPSKTQSFEDTRGIGLSWPLHQACLSLGLIPKEGV